MRVCMCVCVGGGGGGKEGYGMEKDIEQRLLSYCQPWCCFDATASTRLRGQEIL